MELLKGVGIAVVLAFASFGFSVFAIIVVRHLRKFKKVLRDELMGM